MNQIVGRENHLVNVANCRTPLDQYGYREGEILELSFMKPPDQRMDNRISLDLPNENLSVL